MKLIVGLGNPGEEYNNTRHNVGFMAIDNFLGNVSYKSKFNSLYYKKDDIIFVKPETYMNNSGDAVRSFVNYYKVDLEDILIIHDDLDLSIGVLRFKFDSESGGHNGIKSIINNLNSKKFLRLKIGISKGNNDIKDYVLGSFSKDEKNKLDFTLINNAIKDFLDHDYNYLMNKYNRK